MSTDEPSLNGRPDTVTHYITGSLYNGMTVISQSDIVSHSKHRQHSQSASNSQSLKVDRNISQSEPDISVEGKLC